MKVINFEGANVKFGNIPSQRFKDGVVECFITMWQPSKKDLKELNSGKPIILQVYKEMLPTVLYTVNDEGKPNLEL